MKYIHLNSIIGAKSNHISFQRIQLVFVNVEVSSKGACEGDILTIFDGEVVDSCANVIPNEDTYSCSEICMPLKNFKWVSSSNDVTVTFKSDGKEQYRGFEIEYEYVD